MRFRLRLILLLLWAVAGKAAGELRPDQVAIVAMQNSEASRRVAQYYAKVRGIPASQICLIEADEGQTLPRPAWQDNVRPWIRQWILQNELEAKLRCLVTVWDVPLKIGKTPDDDPARRRRMAYLNAERDARAGQVLRLVREIKQLGQAENRVSQSEPPLKDGASHKELEQLATKALQEAGERIEQVTDTEKQKPLVAQFERLLTAVGGLQTIVNNLANRDDLQAQQAVKVGQGRLLGLQEGLIALQSLPPTAQRDERLLGLLQTSSGVLNTIAWIEEQLKRLKANQTQASFDSELSLLFWPEYELDLWQPNVWNHQYDGRSERWARPTLMVARLEAPTLKLTRSIIDTAIEIEKKGLDGTVYLDSRGIKAPEKITGSFAEYDQSLRTLARTLEDCSPLKVVLDTRPGLFQAGACPNTALYCGWYSVGKYVDAFDWVPGSVGFHIASFEATTLRNADSQVWCKRMLEDGVCATLGAVNEPYLHTLPRPHEFFLVLMSGRCSLVETFYRTKPYNSWQLTLVGDPLYNPFRVNPAVDAEKLPEELRRVVLGEAE